MEVALADRTDVEKVDTGHNTAPKPIVLSLTKPNTAMKEVYETPRDLFQKMNRSKKMGEIAFVLGVGNMCLTVYLFGAYPLALVFFYTFKFPTLVLLRFVTYYKTQSHYFLIDVCYFANAFLICALWLVPHEWQNQIFMIAFAVINGPIAWAVLAFRNALVFHSIDKLTSLLIHLTPALVTHVVRFRLTEKFHVCETSGHAPHQCSTLSIQFKNMALFGTVFFFCHQVAYYIFVQQCCMRFNKAFAAGKNDDGEVAYWTSFRWLTRNRKALLSRIIFGLGSKMAPFVFGALNLLYASSLMCLTVLFYHYQWVHFAFLVFIMVVSAHNASTFYYEVFAHGKGGDIF
eukprot:c9120_g1_i1.p1 GENE.c9120_g1_i1~~c9120_g1_i1.p1  ORF type:complete len:365 (+),score=56.95 c9120_g1_i1:62-1096(+)